MKQSSSKSLEKKLVRKMADLDAAMETRQQIEQKIRGLREEIENLQSTQLEQVFQQVKKSILKEGLHVDADAMLPAYLSGKGIDIRHPFHCLSDTHADHHPSMSYRPKTNTVQCYGCGEHGDIFDVIRMEYGLDRENQREIFDTAYRVLGLDVEHQNEYPTHPCLVKPEPMAKGNCETVETDYTDFFREAASHIEDTDYARRRGLSPEVIQRFQLGFDPAWRNPTLEEEQRRRISPSPRLIIPTSPSSYVARDTRETLTEKQRTYAKLKVGHLRIFNAKGVLALEDFSRKQEQSLTDLLEQAKKVAITASPKAILCPECGKPMRRRKGKNGFFWGCTGYPGCSATAPDNHGKPDFAAKGKHRRK